ncbi:hypothetical protein RclHR1_00020029 [Rhizophagus clarus]|uniref:Uncharacterized protein n=1 Tax=Rhizophagus clarus TaxID=94130 RepID=A0A2Z6RIX6_9GLOM|nr:hypothetical protein RclHR1_00020029 [Rhizophagus clarus]GES80156.1 hypothetical protein RCL_jg23106.t1 [Rhizophagus clarus]
MHINFGECSSIITQQTLMSNVGCLENQESIKYMKLIRICEPTNLFRNFEIHEFYYLKCVIARNHSPF